ncbi:hypothetical protein [Coleofasciculus chthonoplastes]|uniref:hypothetical protein n=1 Tax=Coleofasciculus chthonoplastes TaxID=64178 RepID=UPI0032FAFD30
MLGFGASTQPTVIGDRIILQSLDKQRWRNLEVIAKCRFLCFTYLVLMLQESGCWVSACQPNLQRWAIALSQA